MKNFNKQKTGTSDRFYLERGDLYLKTQSDKFNQMIRFFVERITFYMVFHRIETGINAVFGKKECQTCFFVG